MNTVLDNGYKSFFSEQTGSWAGNLMLKHVHQGFQSDIFLTLLAVEAELTIGSAADASTTHMGLEQFLRTDMSKKVILSVTLPRASPNTKVRAIEEERKVRVVKRNRVDIFHIYRGKNEVREKFIPFRQTTPEHIFTAADIQDHTTCCQCTCPCQCLLQNGGGISR